MSNIVQIDPKDFGLEESKASEIAAQFKPMLDKMVELEKEYNEIIALPIDQDAVVKAKALRLKYVKVRTGTAEIHKKQKEFYLSGGRFVDGWKNAQLFASQGIEDKLEGIEKHYENLEKERIANLRAEREAIAIPFGVDVNTVSLGLMTEEVWNNFIAGAKQSYEIKVAAEAKAENERIEKERINALHSERKESLIHVWQFVPEAFKALNMGMATEAEYRSVKEEAEIAFAANELELERSRKENERLKKEAEAKQAELDKAKAEADRIQKEANAKAEAARKEADRIANEKIAAAKAESDRIAAELKAKQDEEDRKAKEAADAEKARIAAEKKAAAAPDKTKLLAFAELISKLETPEMKSEEGKAILDQTKGLIVKLTTFITDKANQI